MDRKLGTSKRRKNLLNLLQYRETNSEGCRFLQRRQQFTESLINRLGLQYRLYGHQGCVNCLQWTKNGQFLASGSDDTKVILWEASNQKDMHVISTNHIGNIFSVKFLGTDNSLVATGAGDCRVAVHTLDGSQMLDCSCHQNRVKRLANSPVEPTVFWSGGEDGRVFQYDLRDQHDCAAKKTDVLIAYPNLLEIKCIAINPGNPNQLAVGAADVFVRVYDRRKIKLSQANDLLGDHRFSHPSKTELSDPNVVQYYSPGHLALRNTKRYNTANVVTHIAFNSTGSEMLANIGGEHVYLFDLNNNRPVSEIKRPSVLTKNRRIQEWEPCCDYPWMHEQILNDYGFDCKQQFHVQNPCVRDQLVRAAQLLERKWMGDAYAAARIYLDVIQDRPTFEPSYLGLLKSLAELNLHEEAESWFEWLCKARVGYEETASGKALKELLVTTALTNRPDTGPLLDPNLSTDEFDRRLMSNDYKYRYIGPCNMTTDIMEANFLGQNDEFICAGSDEGVIFIWDKKSQTIVQAFKGDSTIVNCIQPHPGICVLASSGIDSDVKFWAPLPENEENSNSVKHIEAHVRSNQERASIDPFETMLMNIGFQMQMHEEIMDLGNTFEGNPGCRTS